MHKLFIRSVYSLVTACLLLGCAFPSSKLTNGKFAPYTRVTLLDGDYIALQSFRGRKVAVYFWAGWCSPSKREVQAMQHAAEEAGRNSTSDAVFLAINLDTTREEAASLISAMKLNSLTHAFSGNETLDEAYLSFKIEGMPYGFILNEQGEIIDQGSSLNYDLLQ